MVRRLAKEVSLDLGAVGGQGWECVCVRGWVGVGVGGWVGYSFRSDRRIR